MYGTEPRNNQIAAQEAHTEITRALSFLQFRVNRYCHAKEQTKINLVLIYLMNTLAAGTEEEKEVFSSQFISTWLKYISMKLFA